MANPHKILIVDDDTQICDFLSLLLIRRGYAAQACHNGLETIEWLTKQPFDLVLLDVGLPDAAGEQVMQAIARRNSDTMVVMMTGNASIESAVRSVHSGAYGYLRKPFETEELIKTIENALAHKRLKNDRKKAEKALLESEDRFRNLVENSLIGISIVQDQKFVYQNPAQKSLLGHFSASYNIADFNFVHPDDVDKIKRLYQSILVGTNREIETEFRLNPPGHARSQSGFRWVQCRASSFNYHGQKAILINMIDITRAKELERLIRIKSKMTSLGRIAAGMAHEIRNPLTGINSYLYNLVDLCREDNFESAHLPLIQQIAAQIQLASNKIESVVKRVLDFSKPTTPKMELIDINRSLQDAVDLSAVTLRKSGIEIETTMESDLPRCYGDSHLIEQVILNLINNAAKALEKSGSARKISLSSLSVKTKIVIRVADSGPGVPLEQREKIFEPFFTTNTEGSGIGLSIAQRIVTDHNGSITVGTSRWNGAEFRVEIPIEKRMVPR